MKVGITDPCEDKLDASVITMELIGMEGGEMVRRELGTCLYLQRPVALLLLPVL